MSNHSIGFRRTLLYSFILIFIVKSCDKTPKILIVPNIAIHIATDRKRKKPQILLEKVTTSSSELFVYPKTTNPVPKPPREPAHPSAAEKASPTKTSHVGLVILASLQQYRFLIGTSSSSSAF
jgi:hypothetical protein